MSEGRIVEQNIITSTSPKSSSPLSPVSRYTSDEDHLQPYTGIDQTVEDASDMSEDAAASFIGGTSVTSRPAEGQQPLEAQEELFDDQVTTGDLESGKFKNEHKTFTFQLPFGGKSLSLFPSFKSLRQGLPIIGTNSDEDEDGDSQFSLDEIKYKLKKQQSISTLEESYLFKNKKGADNTRLRALKKALTPNIALDLLSNDDRRHTLDTIWDDIDGDVVVIGGYRGSILRDARTHKRVWIPLRAGFNIRKIDLRIGPRDKDEDRAQRKIIPDGMLDHVGPVDISRKLKAKLDNGKTKVHEFGYDWRLSSDINSQKLIDFLSTLDSNKGPNKRGAIVIAHSMGGLITHHAMQQDPSLFRGVVYAGVPSECPNILGPIRYGDSVMFSSKILTAEVNFMMRSSFVFLPRHGRCFVNKDTYETYNLDYFDPEVWSEYNLSPLVSKERLQKPERRQSLEHATHQKPTHLISLDMKKSSSTSNHKKPTEEFHATYEESMDYLSRTLNRTKKFLDELDYEPTKKYPPLAIVYGNEVPTVRGVRVRNLQDIKDGEYDDFYYGPGDGVVHHKWLMPERRGFPVEAKIASAEGHIQLLTDLPAMGAALGAILCAENQQKHAEEL
ncbi:hypothetical protein BN7_1714 [Wickerhamomyces ciferrii]|uniref:Uncharacterized protein n=1 Tax=Wickerhamomyces ciferrii (strain ATCC 14091 / BCRC 22168 / CBS 111 / JCM 3599 / NBRC 0793 / NRRL Y-1031 F-60-10) TaxID=1206466 RepID=K0KAZ4_WICCF|nr:uncharacterized protein BN7_1714 [Wickerhamomyces ciferrii]CCH42170.1 hypothetical protein BN7_1714 [Wickerhamomyces ciferrii]